jgi:hypothetical protein
MSGAKVEKEAIRGAAKEYEERGYAVTLEPPAAVLPDFLAGYEPDLVARSTDENVLVEVRTRESGASDRLEGLAQATLVNPVGDWKSFTSKQSALSPCTVHFLPRTYTAS